MCTRGHAFIRVWTERAWWLACANPGCAYRIFESEPTHPAQKEARVNQERFKKVYDIISVQSEEFCMDSWEGSPTECGTTRCLSGWAIYNETGAPLFGSDGNLSSETHALARRLGVSPDFEAIGGELLGLTRWQRQVFYVDDETALEFARLASEGREYEAEELLEEAAE